MSTQKDTDFSNGRDSQVGEPYAYIYEFDSKVFGVHRSFSSNQWNGLSPSRCVLVYTAPPTAQINQQMLEALEAFINAWGDCLGYPDTDEERFRLSEARDKAESAVLSAATQMRGDA